MHPSSRGIALLGVMVALAVSTLAVLASARTGLLHEMLTGQQADRARAQSLAQALLLDAEADILGHHAHAPCRPSAGDSSRSAQGFIGCRERGTGAYPAAPYFPQTVDEFEDVRALLQVGAALPCRDGICAPSTLQSLAKLGDGAPEFLAVAARHGQFTSAGSAAAQAHSSEDVQGWYWVEMFHFRSDAPHPAQWQAHPDPMRPFVYRITALAEGRKPGTRVVLQSMFIPHPSSQLQ